MHRQRNHTEDVTQLSRLHLDKVWYIDSPDLKPNWRSGFENIFKLNQYAPLDHLAKCGGKSNRPVTVNISRIFAMFWDRNKSPITQTSRNVAMEKTGNFFL